MFIYLSIYLFYFILLYYILFYFILFYFILFYFILFYYIIFYFIQSVLIPIEFYKALFCNEELLETHPAAGKCLKLIFNKIWNGSFPKKWNSASIVSIPKKGDLSDCSNYRGISLI